MKHLVTSMIVGVGGFLGANLRYWFGEWSRARWESSFPWSTFVVNVTGSLALGLFLGLFAGLQWRNDWRLFIAVGLLGGYTTFSSFAWEAVKLFDEGEVAKAGAYVLGSMLLSLAAAWVGLLIARQIVRT